MSYPDLMYWGESQPVVFDSISKKEKAEEIRCFIYSVDGNSPTGNFFRGKIRNYLALEYYSEELDVEKLIQTWIVLSFDQMMAKASEVPEENRMQL